MGHLAHAGEPRRVFAGPDASDRVSLHAETLLLAEPDGNLAEYPGAEAAPARLLHLGRGPQAEDRGLHRLLQSDDGQAVQVDLPGQATGGITVSSFKPRCTSLCSGVECLPEEF